MIASWLAAGAATAAFLLQAPAPGAVERVPLDLSGPRPVAMLQVGSGEPVRVIFDTGASGNVLDADFARAAGLPDDGPARVGTPAGGPPMIGFRTRLDGRLGNATLSGARAVALPMPTFQNLEIKGVFGPSTFSGRLVFLDLARGEIRVTPKDAGTIPTGEAHSYSAAGPRSLPGVAVEIGGRSHHAHIDTGQPGMLMMPMAMATEVPLDGALADGPPARLADGVPRALSNRGHAVVRGAKCALVGRISMDQTIVDTGTIPVEPGEEVVLLGGQGDATASVESWAEIDETVNYEILCGLGQRLPKVYYR